MFDNDVLTFGYVDVFAVFEVLYMSDHLRLEYIPVNSNYSLYPKNTIFDWNLFNLHPIIENRYPWVSSM